MEKEMGPGGLLNHNHKSPKHDRDPSKAEPSSGSPKLSYWAFTVQ